MEQKIQQTTDLIRIGSNSDSDDTMLRDRRLTQHYKTVCESSSTHKND